MSEAARQVVGYGQAPGTFGELLQGVLPDPDRDFLVTLPIARYAQAVFSLDPGRAGVVVEPAHKHKAQTLAGMLLRQWDAPPGGRLQLRSRLPEGKGLASSSADLVATARAVADALGRELPDSLLLDLLRAIEPSDGIMFAGAVAFYHRQVRLAALLGALPPLSIVGTDEGGAVDTVAFNQRPKPFSAGEKAEYRLLLAELALAIKSHDLPAIGRIATRSAVLNQRLQPKRHLGSVMALADTVGASGVVVAHSGTCLGVLLSPAAPQYAAQLAAVRRGLRRLTGNSALYRVL